MPKEKKRLCPECRGAIKQGQAEMVFDLADITVTVKNVAADVCSKCGQSFITGRVAEEVNRLVNRVSEDVSSFTKTQTEISRRHKEVAILFKSLGEVDAVRFLSQVAYEKRDYVKLQEELFAGMAVGDIYKRAKEYAERKGSKR